MFNGNSTATQPKERSLYISLKTMRRQGVIAALVVALLALFAATAVTAQEPTVDNVKAKFAGTTLADWPDYEKDPFCIDASLAGQPELGAMGFHAGNEALVDAEISVLEPEALVLDGEDNVVAVEYIVPDEGQTPPELFGQTFQEGPPGSFGLHVWLIDNPSGTFAPFNPELTCPEGSLPPPEALPETGGGSVGLSGGWLLAGLGLLVIGAGVLLRRRRVRA